MLDEAVGVGEGGRPDLEHAKATVLNRLTSVSGQRTTTTRFASSSPVGANRGMLPASEGAARADEKNNHVVRPAHNDAARQQVRGSVHRRRGPAIERHVAAGI